jgi:hypothetical protein
MAKSKLTTDQYNELKKFVSVFAKRFFYDVGAPTNGDLLTAFDAMERKSPAQAAQGLMMVINDFIEMSSDWDAEKITAFDAELKSSGIITLTELRRQYSKQYARVIKRGHIKTIEEYYLLKGVLDGGSLEMTKEEQETLSEILVSYENKIMQSKKSGS